MLAFFIGFVEEKPACHFPNVGIPCQAVSLEHNAPAVGLGNLKQSAENSSHGDSLMIQFSITNRLMLAHTGCICGSGLLLSYISPRARMPPDNPLRNRKLVREVLGELNRSFPDRMGCLGSNIGVPNRGPYLTDSYQAV